MGREVKPGYANPEIKKYKNVRNASLASKVGIAIFAPWALPSASIPLSGISLTAFGKEFQLKQEEKNKRRRRQNMLNKDREIGGMGKIAGLNKSGGNKRIGEMNKAGATNRIGANTLTRK